METFETTLANNAWKGRLIKFIIYVAVGFLCAYLYRQLKN